MKLYKKRNFSALLNDTFLFFKKNGKNYFKNYLILNGLVLIAMVVLFVLGYKNFLSVFFEGNLNGQEAYFENYFSENLFQVIVIGIMVVLLFFTMLIFNYLYPIFYMKRLAETGDRKIKLDHILGDIKANLGKVFKFIIGGIFILSPMALIIFGVTYILVFILIGILLMFVITPFITNVLSFHMFDYFNTNRGFFASLGYAVRSQFYESNGGKTPFWKYIGTALVLHIIIQIVTGVITGVSIAIFVIQNIIGADTSTEINSNMIAVFISVGYSVMVLVSLFAMNLVHVAEALMYYDSRTDLHRLEELSKIETIGSHVN